MTVSRNLAMFGCEDMDAFVECVKDTPTYAFSGMNMVVMSLLSDAQEQMGMDDTEGARQTINRAKYLLALNV